MQRRWQAIVFDFDGVLVESVDVKTRAFAALYEPYGPEVVAKIVEHHLAHGGVTRTAKFRHYHQNFLARPLTREAEEELASRFSVLVEDAVVAAPAVPGALAFLERFSSVIPLYVASGTPEEELKRIIERRGMTRYFAGVYGAPRTKGEILLSVAREQRVAASRLLMVGDAPTDFEGALEAGAEFIGRSNAQSTLFSPGTRIIPDLTPLAALV